MHFEEQACDAATKSLTDVSQSCVSRIVERIFEPDSFAAFGCLRATKRAGHHHGAVGVVEIRKCHGEAADDFFGPLARCPNRSPVPPESTFQRLQRGRHEVSLSDIARLVQDQRGLSLSRFP